MTIKKKLNWTENASLLPVVAPVAPVAPAPVAPVAPVEDDPVQVGKLAQKRACSPAPKAWIWQSPKQLASLLQQPSPKSRISQLVDFTQLTSVLNCVPQAVKKSGSVFGMH